MSGRFTLGALFRQILQSSGRPFCISPSVMLPRAATHRAHKDLRGRPLRSNEMKVPVAGSWCGRQPNKRLEQAPPRFGGRILFVTTQVRGAAQPQSR